MAHWSFAPDPTCKGSYYRRIDDIQRAFDDLGIPTLNAATNFVAYFFGCEKLAFGIWGIKDAVPANEAHKRRALILDKVISARTALALPIPPDDLRYLFSDREEQKSLSTRISARVLRNNLVHDYGPQQVKNISDQAPFLIPKMRSFLGCAEQVRDYLKAHFSHVQCGPP